MLRVNLEVLVYFFVRVTQRVAGTRLYFCFSRVCVSFFWRCEKSPALEVLGEVRVLGEVALGLLGFDPEWT